jgi:hypothetical protein
MIATGAVFFSHVCVCMCVCVGGWVELGYNQPTSDQSQAFGQDNTGAAGTGTTPSG